MPGAIQVKIKGEFSFSILASSRIRPSITAGESIFYNSNILHTASYTPFPSLVRATLHATMGCTLGGSSRARNILQHGLGWMREERFRETLPEEGKARAMLDRLLEMEKGAGEVGLSLEA